MHIHENEILLVKFSAVCLVCNGIKHCGFRRWVVKSYRISLGARARVQFPATAMFFMFDFCCFF